VPQLSLRSKYVLSFGVAAILLAGMIVYVDHHNTDASNGVQLTPQGRASANRLAVILAEQDQQPHVVRVPARSGAAAAIAHAVRSRMNALINDHLAGPPIGTPRCQTTTGTGQARGFSCSELSGGQYFNFVGVLDAHARLVTICRRDPPPSQSLTIPISKRCLA
jgi:hypothetical protein